MAKAVRKSYRLSIDVNPDEHRMIKMACALNGETISSYVLKVVRERLRQDLEHQGILVKKLGVLSKSDIGSVRKNLKGVLGPEIASLRSQ